MLQINFYYLYYILQIKHMQSPKANYNAHDIQTRDGTSGVEHLAIDDIDSVESTDDQPSTEEEVTPLVPPNQQGRTPEEVTSLVW
jgi:hypothetical protein